MASDTSRTIEIEIETVRNMMKDLDSKWATISPKVKLTWLNLVRGAIDRLKAIAQAERSTFYPDEDNLGA